MQVTSTIGRWILERFGVYNSFSGITTNQAEGFNTLVKAILTLDGSTCGCYSAGAVPLTCILL